MTKPYRLTPAQWESIERYADTSDPYSCLLDLRARIEALEAAQQPPLFTAEEVARIVAPTVKESLTDPSGSLVERVAWLIAKRFSESRPGTDCLPFGRAAILEVAAWMREQRDLIAATALTKEANRTTSQED
jgi:hypothetical protein